MFQKQLKQLRIGYFKIVNSIAFLPAVIALSFLLFSFLIMMFDESVLGIELKLNLRWLRLRDANTARSIISSIASGLISLTVFSFSMVMILLSQAASQMSNRILDKLIGNRFQQTVLGFYIGTIVYALFLLSTIRDIETGISVPSISTYLLIGLTVIDIFLFIYFLHYITQSIKYDTIIYGIAKDTMDAMKKECSLKIEQVGTVSNDEKVKINVDESGLFQGFDQMRLMEICEVENVCVYFLYPVGTYLMKGNPLLEYFPKKEISEDFAEKIALATNINQEQEVIFSYYYGFRQLMEIAIRALSPGINDPGTAVISLRKIGELLAFRLNNFPESIFKNEQGEIRIVSKEITFEKLFVDSVLPIWQYGKDDYMIQEEMLHILNQLKFQGSHPVIDKLFGSVYIAKNEAY